MHLFSKVSICNFQADDTFRKIVLEEFVWFSSYDVKCRRFHSGTSTTYLVFFRYPETESLVMQSGHIRSF